jgi:hypothetical protein
MLASPERASFEHPHQPQPSGQGGEPAPEVQHSRSIGIYRSELAERIRARDAGEKE